MSSDGVLTVSISTVCYAWWYSTRNEAWHAYAVEVLPLIKSVWLTEVRWRLGSDCTVAEICAPLSRTRHDIQIFAVSVG